eukprot:7536178-Alexandrium_andersonii.AAC.1
MGQTALSAAPNRRRSETPIPQCQAQEARRSARRLLHLAVWRVGGVSDFANSEPRRGPFGLLGVLGPRPPRAA